MDLSVIIVNWNAREYLLDCLEAVDQGGSNVSYDVLVIDNGSRDGSRQEVKKRFPGVRLIENEGNLGFAKAVNQGLRGSTGSYILLLNPDTRVKKGGIEKLIFFMENHPEAGIAGGQLLNGDGSRQNSIANFPTLGAELLNKSLLKRVFPKKFPGKERDLADPIEVESVIGACMMVRRKAIEEVGLLDEDYFLFLEETDWCYRMRKAGWKVYHVPQAEIYHAQGRSAAKVKERAKLEYYRSRYLFFRKNKGKVQWFILHIGLVVKLLVELVLMGMANLLTLFRRERWARKWSVLLYLAWWHLKLCPGNMGLRK